jgi:diguanylate cyclase (GGDEF)-like protein
MISRYGGEEFCIILYGSNEENAFVKANHIRETVENFKFKDDVKITISVGLYQIDGSDHNIDDIFEKVDHALYEAKETGRNKVVIYKEKN